MEAVREPSEHPCPAASSCISALCAASPTETCPLSPSPHVGAALTACQPAGSPTRTLLPRFAPATKRLIFVDRAVCSALGAALGYSPVSRDLVAFCPDGIGLCLKDITRRLQLSAAALE